MAEIYTFSKGTFREEFDSFGGPRVHTLENVAAFEAIRERMRAELFAIPYTFQWKYRGLIAVSFKQPVRAVCSHLDDMYLVDTVGGKYTSLSLQPLEIRDDRFILDPALSALLVERKSSVLLPLFALCLPKSETLHLVDFEIRTVDDQERFSGTNPDLPDHVGYT